MKKILVVDDDKDIADIVRLILKNKGFAVLTHYTGLGVEEIVSDYRPDLILLDINLPGKHGTEICKELKAINHHPPILLFSAHADETKTFSTYRADGFIGKPFEVNKLIEIISLLAA
ncbi:MAG: response regulator [Ginsengibacter sp.]